MFKFAAILVHHSHQSSLTDFRLVSSRLFYLRKFKLAVHTKCQQGAFCMDYQANFRR